MEKDAIVRALAALAQSTRLEIFRLLVAVGPAGLAAGDIARRCAQPATTLSFHLKELRQAGMVTCRRQGRSLIYAADFANMNALMAYLTENCCGSGAGACPPPLCEEAAAPAAR